MINGESALTAKEARAGTKGAHDVESETQIVLDLWFAGIRKKMAAGVFSVYSTELDRVRTPICSEARLAALVKLEDLGYKVTIQYQARDRCDLVIVSW